LVEVLRRFDGGGVEPTTLGVREPSLDDVFLSLTGHRAELSDAPEQAETPTLGRPGRKQGGAG